MQKALVRESHGMQSRSVEAVSLQAQTIICR